MSDRNLFDALARKTGEDSTGLGAEAFFLTGLDRPPAQDSGTQADLARFRAGVGALAER